MISVRRPSHNTPGCCQRASSSKTWCGSMVRRNSWRIRACTGLSGTGLQLSREGLRGGRQSQEYSVATGQGGAEREGLALAIDTRRDGRQEDDISDMTIEQRLALNHYDVDTEPHIKIKTDVCQECAGDRSIRLPSGMLKFKEDKMSFSYEGCLECGSCRISCDLEAIEWSYPRAGFGISYEYG